MSDSPFVTANLADLFNAQAQAKNGPASCDACGDTISDDEPDEGFQVRGKGLYMWTRGDQVRFEEPALCPSCGAAIGLSALARWEIEEEEG